MLRQLQVSAALPPLRSRSAHKICGNITAIVAVKPTNKAGQPAAELAEPRAGTEGNVRQQSTGRAQYRGTVSQALERIRQAARQRKKEKFTALFHHVSIDHLEEAFSELKENAAPGVDGLACKDYEQHLERNLEDLHARVHRGAYRALPSRRVYIPKPDGRQRPIAVAALEDKIVQRATASVLSAIYEEDFLGFSYGFRPGRSTHDAMDALMVGITSTKVNWILDADIRSFLDVASYCTFSFFERVEEARSNCRYLNSYAFCPSAIDVNGLKLSALYTLQDGLSRDAE